MNMKKRGIALALAVIMIISMIPVSAFGADENVVYDVKKPSVGIMNRINSENDLFRRTYLRKADDNFNLVYKFNRTSTNNVNGAGEYLNYYTSMMHHEDGDYWKAYYSWIYQKKVQLTTGGYTYYVSEPTPGNEGIGELFSKNEILMDLSADLTADNHRNYWRHSSKILDRAYASLGQTDDRISHTLISLVSDNNAPDESPVNFRKTSRIKNGSFLGLQLYFTGLGCKCGSSKVANISLGLIDDINPKINNIYASKDTGGVKEPNGFKSGETGYINVDFNENIRFADDEIPTDSVMLDLVIKGANNNIQINTTEVQGRLVKLSANKLIFKFTVPETIGGNPANIYISGISQTQGWINNLGGENKFPLVLLGKDGNKISLTGSLANMTDLTMTSSLITDMAGNPVNWQNSTKDLAELCFLDNVPPTVSTVEINGARISADSNQTSQSDAWPDDIDRSAVFVGIGDTLTYSVKFSEVIDIPEGVDKVTAVLNGSENSVPITLKGKTLESIDNGVNGIKVSRIIFEPITITEDMVPDGTGKPFEIEELTFPSGTVDLRRNVVQDLKNAIGLVVIPAPAQQQYLDTQLPVTETNIADVSGKYTPLFYEGGNKDKEFYFPITVKDLDNIGDGDYASGINGGIGNFAWLDETAPESYPFDYCITASPKKPYDNSFAGGMSSNDRNNLNFMSFTQVETGNYLHIRIRDNVKYNMSSSKLVIAPVDYAQNKGYNAFNQNFSADFVTPEINVSGLKNNFDSVNRGTIGVTVNVKDASGVNPSDVEYQWVAKDSEPLEGNWTDFSGALEAGSTDTSLILKIDKSGLESEQTHEYDLLVRAEDKKGNLSSEPLRVPCIYDLNKSNPNLEVTTGIDKPAKDILIGINLHHYSGSDASLQGLPTTSVLMIKNPEGVDNEYFVTFISSKDGALNDKVEFNADAFSTGDLFNTFEHSKWYSAKVTRAADNSKFDFTDSKKLTTSEDKKLINSIINHEEQSNGAYYGDLELIFVTSYGDTPEMYRVWDTVHKPGPFNVDLTDGKNGEYSPFYLDTADGVYFAASSWEIYDEEKSFYYKGTYSDTTTPGAIGGSTYEIVDVSLPLTKIEGNLNVQEYNLMLAPVGGDAYYYDTIGVKFGKGQQSDGTEGLLWNNGDYVPGGPSKYLKNLDGAKIPFTITNPKMASWGVGDIDFESDKTYVALYYTEHGANSNGNFAQKAGGLDFSDGGKYTSIAELTPLIKAKPMETDNEQNFVIPSDITGKTGFYAFEVSVKSLNSDKVKKFYFADMYADGSEAVGNGIKYFESSIVDPSGDAIFNKYTDANSNSILLGTAASQEGYKNKRSIAIDVMPVEYTVPMLFYYEDNSAETLDLNSISSAIKIWNATSTLDGKAPDYIQWHNLESSYEDIVNLKVINGIGELTESSYTDEEGNGVLPVIADGTNTICYQLSRPNGDISQIYQVNIITTSDAPQFELRLDSDGKDGCASSVTAFAENVVSNNGAKAFDCFMAEIKFGENMEPIAISQNGEYYFYVIDNVGNVTFKKQDINWIDSQIPSISSVNNTAGTPENEFHVTVTMKDDKDLTDGKIYLTFDKQYSSLINRKEVEGSSTAGAMEEFVSMEVPMAKDGQWISTDPGQNQGGIYKTNTVLFNDNLTKTVEIWGAFKYDNEASLGVESTKRLTFMGSDQAENLSEAYETKYYEDENGEWQDYLDMDAPIDGAYLDITAKNIKPEFTGASLTTENKVKLSFSAPVLATAPSNSNPSFGRETDSAAIYNDGLWSIAYRDLFGNNYTGNVNISVFGGFNAKVKFSETEPTQKDVTVGVEIPEGSDVTITGLSGKKSDSSIMAGTIDEDGKTAVIIMTDNGNVTLSMEGAGGAKKERTIAVSNIDRIIEPVTPYAYYTAGVPAQGETITDGPVTVGLYCGELLTGVNGPLTYIFADGAKAGDTYTFQYEDMAKNQGSITIMLNHDVVAAVTDITPPEYSLVLYSKLDYLNQQHDSFTASESIEASMGVLTKAQGYMLSFNVFDESKVKLIAKNGNGTVSGYSDTSDLIDGVIVSDRAISIDKNAEFTAFLVDEKNNITTLPTMKFDKVDNTAPAATVEYVAETFYSTIGYLNPDENVIDTNVSGVEKDTSGTYNGKYYHKYVDNEEFIFYFKDEVGNTASTAAKVDWLDVSTPEVINAKWTPVGAGQIEEKGIYPPPTGLTNKDVIAQVEFNKPVKEIIAYNKGTDEPVDSSKVKISFVQNGAIVTYNENADIDLYFKSYNGKDARFSMGKVECIDKGTFNITESINVSSDKQSAQYTFTTDKEVYMAEDSQLELVSPNTVFKYNFTSNGTYDMHFTDKAGNSVVYTVKVDQLDKEIIKVYLNTEPNDSGAVDSAGKLNLTGKNAFYVKLSKNGTVTFDGKTVVAAANTWIKFDFIPVTSKVFYMLEAIDSSAGTRVFNYINVEMPDTVPPVIIFATPSVSIKEGSTASLIEEKLDAGITVSDNKDNMLTATIKTVTTESNDIVSITDTMAVGKYRVEYEAKDVAGNSVTAYRTLRIYSKDSLNAMINGASAEAEGTMVLNTNDIVLNIENLPTNGENTESCRVYYKAGIMTAGQMKIGATKVETDKFIMTGTGFYTIYIQAQDRKDYITYVYIEK